MGEKKRYLKKFCFFFPDLFLSRGFTKKMGIQNQKNVQKNRKILKNLLMYDKKKSSFSHPKQQQQEPKKTPSPKKKVRKEKKAEIPEKKLKGTAQKRKTNRKNKITGL